MSLRSSGLRLLIWPNIFIDGVGWNWMTLKDFKAEFHGQQRVKVSWAEQRAGLWPEWANDRYRKLLLDYHPSDQAFEALADIVRLCRAANVKLLIVNMPIMTSRDGLDGTVFSEIAHRNGGEPLQTRFETRLRNEISKLGVPYLDVGSRHTLPDADFGDPYHLNFAGAAAFAHVLAPRVADVIESP